MGRSAGALDDDVLNSVMPVANAADGKVRLERGEDGCYPR